MIKKTYTIFIILAIFIFPSIVFAKENKYGVEIISDSFDVGRKIETKLNKIDEEVIYKWNKNNSNKDYYIPTAADYESWIEVTIYNKNNKKLSSDKIYFSKLPVIYINTNIHENKINREEYIKGNMYIQGNYKYSDQYNGDIEIKGRGTSSWHYDKKPYRIKLDKKTDLFGFGKNKNYVLLANYLDPSLMRNKLGFDLANKMGLVTTDSTWVDVILNGKFIGNYQLCEHIRIGKQLVDIVDIESIAEDAAKKISEEEKLSKNNSKKLEDIMKEDLSWLTLDEISFKNKKYKVSKYFNYNKKLNGGILFEFDSEEEKEISNFKTKNNINVNISKPEYLLTNSKLMNYTKNYIQDIEDAFLSYNGYNKKNVHYSKLVDVDSLVSYWLTMEILSNEDASGRSRFAYKDNNGKLTFGPVWDFDISSGAYRTVFGAKGWNITGTISGMYLKQDFWKEIVDDPYFQIKVQEKYWEIRPYLESIIKDNGLIDYYNDYLYESGVANELLWTNKGYMKRSFSGEKGDPTILKKFLKKRIKWLDSVFNTEEKTTKSLYTKLSKNSYKKSKKINIKVLNLKKDSENHGSNYLLSEKKNVKISISTKNIKNPIIYINGIKYKKVSNKITLPYKKLVNNQKNVITVTGFKNNKPYSNYITIRLNDKNKIRTKLDIIVENKCSDINLIRINERKSTNKSYGLKSALYSNRCHSYYDKNLNKISPSNVIISKNTSNLWWGIRQKIIFIALIIILIILILVLFLSKMHIKKKRNYNL